MVVSPFVPFLSLFFLCGRTSLADSDRKAVWHRQFTANVIIPGFRQATLADSAIACGSLSLGPSTNVSFGYNKDSKTCWVYDHLVEYSSLGASAPGTRYFWRLAPRCPAEIGYTLTTNVCYKLYKSSLTWSDARQTCHRDGGLLFFEETQLDLIEEQLQGFNLLPVGAWLGGTDADVEGTWAWFSGKSLPIDSALWTDDQPDDYNGRQDALLLLKNGRVDDMDHDDSKRYYTACQIPVRQQ